MPEDAPPCSAANKGIAGSERKSSKVIQNTSGSMNLWRQTMKVGGGNQPKPHQEVIYAWSRSDLDQSHPQILIHLLSSKHYVSCHGVGAEINWDSW